MLGNFEDAFTLLDVEGLKASIREEILAELRAQRSDSLSFRVGGLGRLAASGLNAGTLGLGALRSVGCGIGNWWAGVGRDAKAMAGALALYWLWNKRNTVYEKVKEYLDRKIVVEEVLASPVGLEPAGGVESLVAGSEIRSIAVGLPNCTARVALCSEADGKLVYRSIGNCVRVGDAIFMPKHLTEQGTVYILPNQEVNFRANKVLRFVYDDDNETSSLVAEDLVCIRPSVSELSVLGLKKVSVAPIPVGSNGIPATAYSRALGQASSGNVRQSTSFGMLSYGGSTTKGWSGGVYMIGNRAAGMHISGDPNKGYAAAYLEYLASQGSKPEGSENWFIEELEQQSLTVEELENSGRLKYVGAGDEVDYLDRGGRYHRFEANVVIGSLQRMAKRRDYKDPAYESTDSGPTVTVSAGAQQVVVTGNSLKGGKYSASSPQEEFSAFPRKRQNQLIQLSKNSSDEQVKSMLSSISSPKVANTPTPPNQK